MKVTFYNYLSQYDGFHIQTDVVDTVKYLTKNEVMELADLRHPVLTKNEFYENMSTDINGKKLNKFRLLGSTSLMVIEPFENPPKQK
jgi:hypothetical protein